MLRYYSNLVIFTVLLVVWVASSIQAQKGYLPFDPQKKLSQFHIDVWNNEKGLPSLTLLYLIQTKDGYLWIGSYDGLLRFDGRTFDIYTKNNTESFRTNTVTKLLEGLDSTLWIGTQGSGLVSYKNGMFRPHGLQEEYVESLYQGTNINLIYVGTRGGGLYVYDSKKDDFEHLFAKELAAETVYDIVEYPSNTLWLATKQGVLRVQNNQIQKIATTGKNIIPIKLYLDKEKNIWIGSHSGVWRYEDQQLKQVLPELANERIHDLKHDLAGNLWIVSRNNVYRHNVLTQQLELLTTDTGDAFDDVRSVWLDIEDDLWIPTARHGLCRLRDGKFLNYTTREGLSHPSINSVAQFEDSLVLVGTSMGKLHLIDTRRNTVIDFPLKTDLNGFEIFNIRQDKDGTIWICSYKGLLKKTLDGKEKLYTEEDGLPTSRLRLTYEDSKGRFWIGTRGEGLIQFFPETNTFKKIGLEKGFTADFVMSITEDNNGNLLVGSNNGGLAIEKENVFKIYDIQNGLPSNLIFNIYCDKQNVLWLATNAGLVRWKDGSAFVFDARQGLPNETIFDVIEDAKNFIWLPSNRGVLRIEKEQLDLLASGKNITLNWTQYDKQDGMKNEQCKGATKSLRTSEGIIWVPTNGGVLCINPNYLPINSHRPPVYIQQVKLDNKLYIQPSSITIQPEQKRLVIDFTALSLRSPEKVKFKYKLEGFDKGWIEINNDKREAVYTNLSSGKYAFHVTAANNDGVWNNEGATLSITVNPHFYETWWFWSLTALAFALGVWGVIVFRTKAIKEQAKELENLILQRTTELRSSNEELLAQQKVVQEHNQIIEKQNQKIIASINYAKRIQDAMLPTKEVIQRILPESFILFLPKDIVSGDFYWVGEQNGKIIVAVVDCTGHGVPGAFMSLIGNDMLNKVVHDYSLTKPNIILDVLDGEINSILKQSQNENRDGMDLVIWTYDPKTKVVEFSGAKNSLIYIQNDELHEIRGDSKPIGGVEVKHEVKYSLHTIKVDSETTFYAFSDGYQDQFGSEKNKKFMKKKLKQLLLDVHHLPMKEQQYRLYETFQKWKGEYPQIDDVLIVGVRLKP